MIFKKGVYIIKWKKYISVLAVLVLITGGVSSFGIQITRAERGEQVNSIEFKVSTDLESGIGDVLDGELDLFSNPVDFSDLRALPHNWTAELARWEARTSYHNLFINPAHEGTGTEAMQDAIERGWIEDPEEVRWLANNTDEEWTVNPFAHEDFRFAMQYLNRQEIVDELLEGFGDPRYSYMDTESEVWDHHFAEAIEAEYDLSLEGDVELMEQMIEDAMEDIKENVAFGEVRFEDGYWQYRPPEEDWHDIEIIIIARTVDWREDLGNHLVDILQDLGFDAWADPTDATQIQDVFFGQPNPYDDLAYHIYTGRWFSSEAKYYQEERLNQHYAPWYEFMQVHVEEERWNYDEEGYTERVQKLDDLSKEIFEGEIESEEEYWEKKIEATQLGFEESVRVFLSTEIELYLYNPDGILDGVTNIITGYDTYFTPRTIRTDDGNLEIGDDRVQYRTYFDNWNQYGGSDDIYGRYKRDILREYGSLNHPKTGRPMEINVFWSDGRETDPYERHGDVEWDYGWTDDGELIENIEIPNDAVDYVPAEERWKTVEEMYEEDDRTAAVKVTLDVHEEHVWHDGSEFTIQDLMIDYAREKRLACSADDPYLDEWEDEKGEWYDTIHALEWDEEEGTYTVYGNYTFPIEEKVGDHYTMFPEAHPLTYEGWDHMHGDTEIYDGSELDERYDYSLLGEANWIHQLSSEQNADLVEVIETMIDEEYLPPYLDEEQGSPIPMDIEEMEDRLTSLKSFIEEYYHSYIGLGPFYLENSTDRHEMRLEMWDEYGFPSEGEEAEGVEFVNGYWSAQFEPVDEMTCNLTVEIEGEGTVLVNGEEIEDGGSKEFFSGTEVEIEVEPEDNWTFVEWTGDHKGETENITITIDEDMTIKANFEEEEEEMPGFTYLLLAVSAVISVLIYHKKTYRSG